MALQKKDNVYFWYLLILQTLSSSEAQLSNWSFFIGDFEYIT